MANLHNINLMNYGLIFVRSINKRVQTETLFPLLSDFIVNYLLKNAMKGEEKAGCKMGY